MDLMDRAGRLWTSARVNRSPAAAGEQTGGRRRVRTALRMRVVQWLRAAMGHPRAPALITLASVLLLGLTCTTGLSTDDYAHDVLLHGGRGIAGFARKPWDIFRFTDPDTNPVLRDQGLLNWWDDDQAKLAFMRPLSALTHYVDYQLFPKSPPLMHLHSILWGLVVFAGVIALYRQLLSPEDAAPLGRATRRGVGPGATCRDGREGRVALPCGWLFGLAVFFYVLDDARVWFASWVAGRNTVVATALSVWVLVLHVAYRKADRGPIAWGAVALFAAALLAGEGSLSICAYLLAYALFLDSRGVRKSVRSLWPYLMVCGLWRTAYQALDYGVVNSGLYVDPAADPLGFLLNLLEHGPVLLFSQLGGAWSDYWTTLLFVFPKVQAAILALAGAAIVLFAYLIQPLWRSDPKIRFFLTGALLALLPATLAFPADRLLNWVSIGAAPVLAGLIVHYLPAAVRGRDLRTRLGVVTACGLLVVHMVLGPLAMISRGQGNNVLRAALDRADRGVPKDEHVTRQEVIFLNPPAVPLASYLPLMRAARGEPRPERQLVLSVATAQVAVRRIARNALALSSALSPIVNPGSRLFYGRNSRLAVGDERVVGRTRIKVTAVDERGAPLAFEAHFDRDLSDDRYVFLEWRDGGYVRFSPPAVGETVTLPAADYMEVFLGDEAPFAARHPLANVPPPEPPNAIAHAGADARLAN